MEKEIFKTERLSLEPLSYNDTAFILKLVNTPGWLQFIGDRNVRNEDDTSGYIQKILENQHVTYWIVKLNTSKNSIGIITFIKRDYLDAPDIGFAFLPEYEGHGFAFEAANVILKEMLEDGKYQQVMATTLRENVSSIKLLERLDFTFDKIIQNNEEQLLLYTFTKENKVK